MTNSEHAVHALSPSNPTTVSETAAVGAAGPPFNSGSVPSRALGGRPSTKFCDGWSRYDSEHGAAGSDDDIAL